LGWVGGDSAEILQKRTLCAWSSWATYWLASSASGSALAKQDLEAKEQAVSKKDEVERVSDAMTVAMRIGTLVDVWDMWLRSQAHMARFGMTAKAIEAAAEQYMAKYAQKNGCVGGAAPTELVVKE
jgi:hypothetical protein